MIFVTLGSQKFQFNRLLKEIDRLIEEDIIAEEVFAQAGYSDYEPKNYKYKNFLDRDEFVTIMEKSDKVITHGGTGAIISAVKNGKKVIAIPRLQKYGEHVDNHQKDIVIAFKQLGLINTAFEVKDLYKVYDKISVFEPKSFKSNTEIIINDINKFINSF